jgi:hypothetical protein
MTLQSAITRGGFPIRILTVSECDLPVRVEEHILDELHVVTDRGQLMGWSAAATSQEREAKTYRRRHFNGYTYDRGSVAKAEPEVLVV